MKGGPWKNKSTGELSLDHREPQQSYLKEFAPTRIWPGNFSMIRAVWLAQSLCVSRGDCRKGVVFLKV